MTRTTEHTNLTNDGRDTEWIKAQERAATFNAASLLADLYSATHPSEEEN